ncbi:organic solute transporter Ostalpha-domain-containing protein [Crepidotus variabilis]|uniref:Organic solute transporter Ostalpha-domain-containing protein n=1 Tax=Crepidotus variabilis TaxID=179855 RepID=A0A9P6JSB3_9AGAR|nr:organic solute transporter Ostalpha-domain-containing protein [Crepidotus variabilis]
MVCSTSSNTVTVDQTSFWDENGMHWDTHRIGWAVSGGCAAITLCISLVTILQHCRNYTNPGQQRQILRILYMPPIYAIISFCSYRFFREYTYYSFIQIAYEAVTLSAFLLLIIEYVAATATGHSTEKALERKDKTPLPMPFCCWRYRPTKTYFMYTTKWSVLQYVIIRPAASVAGIICEHYEVLCQADGYTFKSADVYIEIINFISITIALYGLLVFYGLTKEELERRRPMAKFLSIKLIVMFTFYQAFVFGLLEGRVIKETEYWTATNIANGLDALAICIEMVFFSGLMLWAYTPKEYQRKKGMPATSIWRPLWDSINFSDFAIEIASSFRFFFDYVRGKPSAHGHGHRITTDLHGNSKMDFSEAFGLTERQPQPIPQMSPISPDTPTPRMSSTSQGEEMRLNPYPFSSGPSSIPSHR